MENDPTNSDDKDGNGGGGEGSRKRKRAGDDDDDDAEDPPAPAPPATKRRLRPAGTSPSPAAGDADVPAAAASSPAIREDSNEVEVGLPLTAEISVVAEASQEPDQAEDGSKTRTNDSGTIATAQRDALAATNKDDYDEARPTEAASFKGKAESEAHVDEDSREEKALAPNSNARNDAADVSDTDKNDASPVEVSDHAGEGNQENPKSTTSHNGSSVTDNSNDPYDKLRWITVQNDGRPESMIKLIGLKSLFAKQLPKMPRAYIARLVLDRRHTSLAILSDNPALKDSDEEIIGGICYRAFEKERFAEIAFCAVNASHQVKGYGTKLMNLLKQTGARTGIEFFITYADNYAIGYFKKQGFTKSISMPKGRYQGLIKDYDGGTPMECYVHPSVDYFRVPAMIQQQRAFLLHRIARTAQSATTVYPPLVTLATTTSSLASSRAYGAAAKALAVPGVAQAGWTLQDLVVGGGGGGGSSSASASGGGADGSAAQQKQSLKQDLLALVKRVEEQQFAWPFREPVDTTEVPDYLDVIAEPIDLRTIEKRIQNSNHYKSRHMLLADLQLMVDNCKTYNEDGSTYTQCAEALENFVHQLFGPTTMTLQGDSRNTTATTSTTTAAST